MFLLISSLVGHKAKRLVSRYKVLIRKFIEYRAFLKRKRVAHRGWRRQGCEVQGSAFESHTFHLDSMTLVRPLSHFESLHLQLKRGLKIILFAPQD